MKKDLSLEELASIAKEAQAKYDKAVHESKKSKHTIVATSTKEGFTWECDAPSDLVIKHTNATIDSAIETLQDSPLAQIQLVMGIMETLQATAKAEAKKL